MTKHPPSRRVRLVGLVALVAALTTATFSTTSSAKHVRTWLGQQATRSATAPATHSNNNLPAPAPAFTRAAAQDPAQDQRLATIATDQDDYEPGATVTITGGGWDAGETVSLQLHKERDGQALGDSNLSATADADGHISNAEYATTEQDRGVRYTLSATGQTSGRWAQTVFTDTFSANNNTTFSITTLSGGQPCANAPAVLVGQLRQANTTGTYSYKWYAGTVSGFALNAGSQVASGTFTLTSNIGGSADAISLHSATNPNLNVSADGKFYLFSVTDSANVTRNSNYMQVSGTPLTAITKQPVALTVCEGALAQFQVQFDGTAPRTVQWQVSDNGGMSYINFGPPHAVNNNGATDNLQFTAAATDTGKLYQAVVTTACGPAVTSSAALLTVNVPTVITQQPANASILTGQNASFTVNATGAPMPSVQWEQQAPGGGGFSPIPGALSYTYMVTGATLAQDGTQFRAVFTNACGAAQTSNAATLSVTELDPPVTTATLSPPAPNGTNGWYTGPVMVTLSATDYPLSDPSGVQSTSYSVDGGPPQTYSAPFTLSSDGTHTVSFSSTDNRNNAETPQSIQIKIDQTKPSLSLPADITEEATGPGGAAVSYSSSASDLTSGVASSGCTPASGSTFTLGTTAVNCSATDNAGNTETGSFNVTVQDTTPPTLTVPADQTAEATGPNGAHVTYTEASATDLVDANPTVNCDHHSGDLFPLGTTLVTCTASDHNAPTPNTSAAQSFNVTVQDTTPPVIDAGSVPADITAEATGPNGAAVNFSNPTANDIVDGSVATVCTPASGSTFALGTHTVSCTATDAHHNTSAPATFHVTVQDTTPPTSSSSLSGTAGNSPWYVSNVTVTLSAMDANNVSAVTIKYQVDGGGQQTYSAPFTLSDGTHTVSFYAVDAFNNTETPAHSQTIKIDTVAPTATITAPANSASYLLNQVVNANYSCADATSGVATCVGTVANSSPFNTASIGAKTFTVNTTDQAGNTGSASATYSVIYNFNGFFQPVDNLPVVNKAQAGSAIPVKFSLGGNQGLNIFAAGFPVSGLYPCSTTDPAVDIEQTVNAGGSSLNYDPVANQYVYVWKTDKAWASTCRQLIVKLADGTEHRANFQFKK